MAELNISRTTTTNFTDTVPDFIVRSKSLDAVRNNQEETYWYFQDAPKYWGYYLTIPEIFNAANAMATWAVGAGWDSDDPLTYVQLRHVVGMGKDTFGRIAWNHLVTKLICGDSFIEIKYSDDKELIVNLINISPERVRVVFNKSGMIKRYDVWNGGEWKPVPKENMIHSSNKRIGDQMHGTSNIEPAKFIVDARNEALSDERTIKHRDKALGIVYYQTDKEGKISYVNSQIEKAVKRGEMVGIPEGTAKIEPYPSRSSEDRQAWIQYLENFFYQVFGVPRSIATSDGTSEVGGKMGNVNFEPTYAKERTDMEEDFLAQAGISVIFEKQAQLGGLVQQNEAKNTGQTNIQPNDSVVNLNRE